MEFVVDRHWLNGYPSISKPEIKGYLSRDKTGKIDYDLSQLKYLHCGVRHGKVDYDLDALCKNHIPKPDELNNTKIDAILQWILDHPTKLRNSQGTGKWLTVDFICNRGLLTKLWTTPYEKRDGWIICASKYKGNIYLCAYDTDFEKQRKENMTAKLKKFCTWGFVFEHYLLSDHPMRKPVIEKTIYEAEEFNCLFTTTFGTHTLFYAAEMDGILTNNKIQNKEETDNLHILNQSKFVELKTNRHIESYNQEKNFINKMLKWWCQSFLVGIQDIVCGFRNDDGKVEDITFYKMSDLLEMSMDEWIPGPPLNFCDSFLRYVKNVVRKDFNQCVYKFSWNPGNNVIVEELHPNSEYAFLPHWFTSPEKF